MTSTATTTLITGPTLLQKITVICSWCGSRHRIPVDLGAPEYSDWRRQVNVSGHATATICPDCEDDRKGAYNYAGAGR